jgi:hypothetical protein
MNMILMLAALAVPVLATASPSVRLIKDVEGVYKHRFPHRIDLGNKHDEKYTAEDVIEVVHHGDEHIYLRASLTLDNGHVCHFHGIAGYDKGAFVYYDPNPNLNDKQVCTVTIAAKGESLTLSDRAGPTGPSTCTALCGTRGHLGDYAIPASGKEKITYLAKLKASKEYRQAVKAHEDAQR